MKAEEAIHKTHQFCGGGTEHSVAGDVIEMGFSLTCEERRRAGCRHVVQRQSAAQVYVIFKCSSYSYFPMFLDNKDATGIYEEYCKQVLCMMIMSLIQKQAVAVAIQIRVPQMIADILPCIALPAKLISLT